MFNSDVSIASRMDLFYFPHTPDTHTHTKNLTLREERYIGRNWGVVIVSSLSLDPLWGGSKMSIILRLKRMPEECNVSRHQRFAHSIVLWFARLSTHVWESLRLVLRMRCGGIVVVLRENAWDDVKHILMIPLASSWWEKLQRVTTTLSYFVDPFTEEETLSFVENNNWENF